MYQTNNNRIGVYNLNNPFSSRPDSLEQAHQESLKEKINFCLANMLPRIKEVMTDLITEKVNGPLLAHSQQIKSIKEESLQLETSLKDKIVCQEINLIYEAFNDIKTNTCNLKSSFTKISDFTNSIQETTRLIKTQKDESLNLLENINNLTEDKIQSYKESTQIYENQNLNLLKSFIMDKIKKVGEAMKSGKNVSDIESLLYQRLISSLNKIEILQKTLSSINKEKNIIEHNLTENYHSEIKTNTPQLSKVHFKNTKSNVNILSIPTFSTSNVNLMK